MSRTLRFAALLIVACSTTTLSADEYRRWADIAIGGGEAWRLAFMPDGKRIVVGGNRRGEGTVQVWDVASKERVKEFKGHEAAVWTVAVSADGKLIASGGMDNTARIWDYATGKEIAKIDGFGDRVTS
ncbi:MAG TPA: hypothetical protein VHR66_03800, partial [Gemmataceae bacterium]|nr:hypothetical protein [Gemmataceae bacterium]